MFVFVYGSLKRGEPNHHWMTEKGTGRYQFYAKGETVIKYPLVIGSRYNIPYLLDVPGRGNHVQGEIYEIDQEKLAHLDVLEDYPKYYTRRTEQIRVVNSPEHKSLDCIVYFLLHLKEDLLNSPFYSNYESDGAHGRPYVAVSEQDSYTTHL